MKRLSLVLVAAGSLWAQGLTIYGSRTIEGSLVVNGTRTSPSKGTTLPATCTIGDIFFKTNGTSGGKVYGCETTDTWVVQGTVGSVAWGALTGTLSSQTDLVAALLPKLNWTQNTSNPSDPCPGAGAFPSFHTNSSLDTYWGCNGTNTWSQIITDGGAWVNPSWISSLPFTKITGVATKAQQHASTVYNDQTNTFGAGLKQLFTSNGTTAGFNLVPFSGPPSSPANGDIWYDSALGKFRCRENGASADCIGSGGGSVTGSGTANRIAFWSGSTALGNSNIAQHSSTGALQWLKGASDPSNVVISSSTPNFDLSVTNSHETSLTSNATYTFSNAPASPASNKFIRLIWRQDSTGGRTVTCPAAVLNCVAPDLNPLAVTIQFLEFDGTNYSTGSSNCVSACSSGLTDWYGKTSGHAPWGVRDIAGTPANVDVPSADPTAAGYMLRVTQAGSGATHTQLAYGPGPQFCAGTDAGGDDTYVISCPNFPAAYATDLVVLLTVATGNTSGAALDAGLGSKAIKLADGTTDPATGDFPAGASKMLRYDAAANSAAGAWILTL